MPKRTISQLKTGFWLYNEHSGELYQCQGADFQLFLRPNQQTYGKLKILELTHKAANVPVNQLGIINSGCLYSVNQLLGVTHPLGNNSGFDVELEIQEDTNQSEMRFLGILATLNSYGNAAQPAVPAAAPPTPPTPSPQGNAPTQQVWVRGSGITPPAVPGIAAGPSGFVPGDLSNYPDGTVLKCVYVAPIDQLHYTVGAEYKIAYNSTKGKNVIMDDTATLRTHVGGMHVIIERCPMNVPAPTGKPNHQYQQQPVQHAPTPDTDEPDNWDRMATGQSPKKPSKPYEPDKIDRVENF